jgi:DNA recombination protein RmuC
LDAVEKKLHQATDTIEKAKVRSRAIGRKLKDVQELPATDATLLLPDNLMTEEEEPAENDVLEAEEVGE